MANRLANEASPYLRQHATNPVDWWPWGDEAFAEARRRNVPVLLSVGYSSCHWCHVMARESFEDPETAEVMNAGFVNIKVDREQRPDIDAIYMEATQAMVGRGGWPMTTFLLPDGRPFYCGTYWPPEQRGQTPPFRAVLQAVTQAWHDSPDDVAAQAAELTGAIVRATSISASPGDVGVLPDPEDLLGAVAGLIEATDHVHGGFGTAPKFPQPLAVDALLRFGVLHGNDAAVEAARVTLDGLVSGGIYDHLAGGFARYSTDDRWLVPHFEKMLYDQALVLRILVHGWQATGSAAYRQAATETVAFVLRELTHPDGGFYSALDADTDGVEGKHYVWTLDEVRAVLADDPEAFEAAIAWYDLTEAGNWEGVNVLHRNHARADLARPAAVERARVALLAARSQRTAPGLDDKVLTEWNGLLLSALCEAAGAFDEPRWAHAAVRNAEFLLANLRRADGRWLRSWQAEVGASTLAFAGDHAALVDGFVRLYELTGEVRWVDEARATARALLELFWDHDAGVGLFTAGSDAEPLVARAKEVADGALPSANSAGAVALARLAHLLGDDGTLAVTRTLAALLGPTAVQHPVALANVLVAIDWATEPAGQVVVTGRRPDLVATAQRRWLPRTVLAHGERFDSPVWATMPLDEPGRAYVCESYTCQAPVDTPEALAALLDLAPPS